MAARPDPDPAPARGGLSGVRAMSEGFTRRAAIVGGACLLAPLPLQAAPSDFDWRPATVPPGTSPAFVDGRGKAMTLAAFRGKPVLLNIWATWCAPCVIELPALDRLQHDLQKQLKVIALSVDRAGMAEVRKALRRLSIRHLDPYLDASGDSVSQLKLAGLPATLAISATGDFLQVRRGRVTWDDPAERKRLRELLGI